MRLLIGQHFFVDQVMTQSPTNIVEDEDGPIYFDHPPKSSAQNLVDDSRGFYHSRSDYHNPFSNLSTDQCQTRTFRKGFGFAH